ncbi:MAG TPA: hypothetical protein GX702_09210 [Chloroflexi bacterium]|jgi:tetratricopeptide (TPR) repeat protein|nr:hypothetical protein [Chloroflexota bacterium]
MNDRSLFCPYCGGNVPTDTTICPDCHEDLAALLRLEYAYAIHYNEALAAAREDRLDVAEAGLHTAIRLNPTFLPAHRLLAKVYARQGDWERAQAAIHRAFELAEDDGETVALSEAIGRAEQEAKAQRIEREQEVVREAIARERQELAAQARLARERAATDQETSVAPEPADEEPLTISPVSDEEIERFYEAYEKQSTGAFLLGMGMATFAAILVSRLTGRKG